MNGLVPMTLGSWRYYDHELAVEDYYLGHGQEPGRWLGSGAAAEGLSGVIEEGQLAALFDEARHPLSGAPLGLAYRHDAKRTVVTGFALSFSPPKSVSLLGTFGDGKVSAEVRVAHDAAVRTALGFLEDHAAFSRTGRGGSFQVDTEGYLAAAFTHHTSRAGDPQLHTHVLVANKVRCADGRWRSLDGRELFAFQKSSGMLYNATLRVELSARLGVEWDPVDRHGQADIQGVPQGLIDRFSKRRQDVERRGAQRIATAEARLGRTLTDDERAEQYQFATYETRPAKTHEEKATLAGRWRAEAQNGGWDPERWLPETLERGSPAVERREVADPAEVAELVEELAQARSTWSRAEVAKVAARRLPPELATDAEEGRAWIEATCTAVLSHPEVVTLASPLSGEVPRSLRRRDGLPTHERHGASRHSTRETLAREGRILDALVAGREAGVAVAPHRAVEAAARRHRLGADQAAALRRVGEAGERLTCVVGPAGSGKTRMVRAARDAWTAGGSPVRGLAVSAVAAGVLAEDAGMPTDTLAKFLLDGQRQGDPACGLRPSEVVVLDEAAMVATADLAALVDAVVAAEAKLVLVGDHRQLGAVEAGGLFRLLVTDSRAAELEEVRRFSHPWEAKGSLRLRRGDDSVLEVYEARGRIVGGTREEMIDEAFATWRAAREAGESVVVVAPDHATVDALALRARAHRVAAGEVERMGIPIGDQVVGRGDEIVTTRNDRRLVTTGGLWVRNGDRWRVDERCPDGALVVSHLDGHRGRVLLPAEYTAEHVALAYAVTVHKAQGVTVDRAVLLADAATSAEHLYVGMTRGRHENRACVVTEAADTGHGWSRSPEAVEILAQVMGRSSAERSASETLRAELHRGEDLAMLQRLWEAARAHIDTQAGPDRGPELERLRQRERALPILAGIHRVDERELARVEATIARTAEDLSRAKENLEVLTRRRMFRRPDRFAIDQTRHRIEATGRELGRLQRERDDRVSQLEAGGHALRRAKEDAARIPEVEAAMARRRRWMHNHPGEVAWEADLAGRIAERPQELGVSGRDQERDGPDHEHELTPLSGDWLRASALSPHRPRSGMERSLRDALGFSRNHDGVDIDLLPMPERGLDGPGLGR